MQPDKQSTRRFANIDFSFVEISSVGGFWGGCLRSFADCRMGRREWMAWMWYAHETIPSVHSASVTWDAPYPW